MSRKKELDVIKRNADKWFSWWIRRRDCLKTTGNPKFGKCYTCPGVKAYAELENGHFVKRRHLKARYDEVNCNAQCINCNKYLDGNDKVYKERLIEEHGQEKVDELLACKHITLKLFRSDYEAIVIKYKTLMKSNS